MREGKGMIKILIVEDALVLREQGLFYARGKRHDKNIDR